MSERNPGGFITKTEVVPDGQYENSSASGVWSLDEALTYKAAEKWPTSGLKANWMVRVNENATNNVQSPSTIYDPDTGITYLSFTEYTSSYYKIVVGSFNADGSTNWCYKYDGGSADLYFQQGGGDQSSTHLFLALRHNNDSGFLQLAKSDGSITGAYFLASGSQGGCLYDSSTGYVVHSAGKSSKMWVSVVNPSNGNYVQQQSVTWSGTYTGPELVGGPMRDGNGNYYATARKYNNAGSYVWGMLVPFTATGGVSGSGTSTYFERSGSPFDLRGGYVLNSSGDLVLMENNGLATVDNSLSQVYLHTGNNKSNAVTWGIEDNANNDIIPWANSGQFSVVNFDTRSSPTFEFQRQIQTGSSGTSNELYLNGGGFNTSTNRVMVGGFEDSGGYKRGRLVAYERTQLYTGSAGTGSTMNINSSSWSQTNQTMSLNTVSFSASGESTNFTNKTVNRTDVSSNVDLYTF